MLSSGALAIPGWAHQASARLHSGHRVGACVDALLTFTTPQLIGHWLTGESGGALILWQLCRNPAWPPYTFCVCSNAQVQAQASALQTVHHVPLAPR